jgi:hypothetical protein
MAIISIPISNINVRKFGYFTNRTKNNGFRIEPPIILSSLFPKNGIEDFWMSYLMEGEKMTIKPRQIVRLSTILIILSLGVFVCFQNRKFHEQEQYRKLIFCSELKLGMNINEIRQVLNKYGEYRENPWTVNGVTYVIQIDYSDEIKDKKIGVRTVYLNLDNDLLVNVTEPMPGEMDQNRSLCGY